MRVVLDTNILVSAYVFPGGPPEQVVRLAIGRRIDLVTSRPLLLELARVLELKFGWERRRVHEVVAQIARLGVVVRPSVEVREVTADPADDRVLEAALAGKAEAIVSGDKHLLRLGTWRGVRVESTADFLRRVGG